MSLVSISAKGQVKTNNEDAYLIDNRALYNGNDYIEFAPRLICVLDGVGGAKGGEKASIEGSKLLAESFSSLIRKDGNNILSTILSVNSKLLSISKSDDRYKGMATTIAGVFFHKDNSISVLNLGDSRVYRYRAGLLRRLSFDDNRFNYAVSEGLFSDSDEKAFDKDRVILNYLSKEGLSESDIHLNRILNGSLPGDIFLVCSDGLTSMVEDKEIQSVIEDSSLFLGNKATKLTQMIEERGSTDNYTFILYEV